MLATSCLVSSVEAHHKRRLKILERMPEYAIERLAQIAGAIVGSGCRPPDFGVIAGHGDFRKSATKSIGMKGIVPFAARFSKFGTVPDYFDGVASQKSSASGASMGASRV